MLGPNTNIDSVRLIGAAVAYPKIGFGDRDWDRGIKKEVIAQFFWGAGRPGELEQP